MPGRDVRYAVSIDDDAPVTVTLVSGDVIFPDGDLAWERTVADNMRQGSSQHHVGKAGCHTLKVWMIDPGVVLERIVVDCGGAKPSVFGPPESFRRKP
jgi:hypothetical protein